MNNLKQKDFLWLAPIVVLLIGLLPMPYVFYTLSRIIICFCSVIFILNLINENNILILLIFIFAAILYNPIIPIHLYDKSLWIFINIPTMLLFYLNRNKL